MFREEKKRINADDVAEELDVIQQTFQAHTKNKGLWHVEESGAAKDSDLISRLQDKRMSDSTKRRVTFG